MAQTPQPRPRQPCWIGLLPWQGLFCAWVLGLLGWQWPLPATLALLIFAWSWLWPWKNDTQNYQPRRWLIFIITAFALGVATIHFTHPQPDPGPADTLEIDHRRPVQMTGLIREVLPKPGGRLQIIIHDVYLGPNSAAPRPLGGALLWNWQDPPVYPQPGQTVSVNLNIRPIQGMANPGMNRTEDYWARQGVYFRAYSQKDKGNVRLEGKDSRTWALRERLRKGLLENTPEGQGQAMLLALLMGDRFLLRQDTMDLVQRASLSHSLALSGLHLGFVVSLGWLAAHLLGLIAPRIYLFLPRPKLAVILSFPLVLSYLWLGQAVPSLLRAALMFASWGLLLLLGRQRVLLDGLFLALVVILALSPLAVFDLRLQLSAMAVAGLALAWPLGRSALALGQRPWWQKPLTVGLGILAVSFVATLSLLPLQAWFFGQISPHLYLNVLWLPLLGMVVFPLGLGGLLLLMLPGGELLAGVPLGQACHVLEAMLGGLSFLEKSGLLAVSIPARPLWPQFIGYWMLLVAAAVWWKNPQGLRPGIICMALLLLLAPILVNLAQEQRQQVSLRLLDVGQGQALLVEAPGGKRWLVDGGGFWSRDYDIGRAVVSPALTHGRPPRLSGIVLSHADFDHYLGLYYPLGHFQIGGYSSQGREPAGSDGEILRSTLNARGIAQSVWAKGDTINLDRNLVLEVLHPDEHWIGAAKNNNASLVLRLLWHGQPLALIPGDIELPAIAALLQNTRDLSAEVLILPHHGSRTSFSATLYDRVGPRLALVSTGYMNRFNHPHPEIVQALKARKIPLLNTAEHGAITVRWKSPSASFEVRTERSQY